MILLPHLLLGALIGQKVLNPYLAIILALLSHYFLDLLPHIEYPIENIVKKQWRRAAPDILKVILDILAGILLISIFSANQPIIYICAFFAILPDGLSILNLIVENKILNKHSELHQNKIHFLKQAKIPSFWRFATQIATAIISVILLKI